MKTVSGKAMRSIRFGLLMLSCAPAVSAEVVNIGTSTSTLSQLYAYSAESSVAGDYVVGISSPLNASVCEGGWISKQDAEYSQIVQMLIVAKATGALVYLRGDSARLWRGSGGKFCYIHEVGLL
jgi:hypothetical protein